MSYCAFPAAKELTAMKTELTDMSGPNTFRSAKLVLSVLTPPDVEVASTLGCVSFQRIIVERHYSSLNHAEI
eukprot:5393443-Ditylum_brightwellii.AAC.1